MVQDIHETSKPVGLNMHLGKTKVMWNLAFNKTDININGRKIEEVDNYIYLSQMVSKDHDQEQELRCRIGLGWAAFGKLDSIMWNKRIPLRLKTKVHNECILPVIMLGSETWSLSKTQLQKMVTTQCKMEWIMMGLTLHDRKSASWICSKTGVIDVICQNLHQQAPMGRACLTAERQQVDQHVTEWCPWDHKWPRGHPKRHWWDDLEEAIGPRLSHVVQDRCWWIISREGFLQQEWSKTLMMIPSSWCEFDGVSHNCGTGLWKIIAHSSGTSACGSMLMLRIRQRKSLTRQRLCLALWEAILSVVIESCWLVVGSAWSIYHAGIVNCSTVRSLIMAPV